MLKKPDQRSATIILLAVAINAMVLALWLVLLSVVPIRVTPGAEPLGGIGEGTGWVIGLWTLGVWLALSAIVGVLLIARMLGMRRGVGAPASVNRLAERQRAPSESRWHVGQASARPIPRRVRPTSRC